jgi:hypothetical protein
MATRTEDPGVGLEHAGERSTGTRDEKTGTRDETKWAPLTTEFWAMLGLIAAVLVAAYVSDNLDDVRAWTLVTIIGAAYILSRGFAKMGSDHMPFRARGGNRS